MQFGFAPIQAVYRASLRECRKILEQQRPLVVNRVVHVVASRSAKVEAEKFFAERFLAFYDRWGHADIRRLDAEHRSPGETARAHFIIGEPSECVELIGRYAEMGIGHLACLMNFGKPDPDLVEASLRRFGEQVLPRCADL